MDANYLMDADLDMFAVRADGAILDPDGEEIDLQEAESLLEAMEQRIAELWKLFGKLRKCSDILTSD